MPEVATARTALIVGGSRGIGLATARRLGAAGMRLLLVARDARLLSEAADSIGAQVLALDVGAETSVDRLQAGLRDALGVAAPDVLVNAAGAFELGAVRHTSLEMFDRSLAANLRAPFVATRAFLGSMLERGSGHIVTIGSVAGRQAFPHNGAYSAAKFGVRGLHAVLDQEVRGTGVRSTLIEPAATDTAIWDRIDRSAHGPLPPREGMLQPLDVAEAVFFAISCPPRVDVRVIALERS